MTKTIGQKEIENERKYAVKQIRLAKGTAIEPYELRWIAEREYFSLRINYKDANGKQDFYSVAI